MIYIESSSFYKVSNLLAQIISIRYIRHITSHRIQTLIKNKIPFEIFNVRERAHCKKKEHSLLSIINKASSGGHIVRITSRCCFICAQICYYPPHDMRTRIICGICLSRSRWTLVVCIGTSSARTHGKTRPDQSRRTKSLLYRDICCCRQVIYHWRNILCAIDVYILMVLTTTARIFATIDQKQIYPRAHIIRFSAHIASAHLARIIVQHNFFFAL